MKTQQIRLVDVLVLGPLMIYAGKRLADSDDQALGVAIGLSGAATMAYNLRNYVARDRLEKAESLT